MGRGIFAGIGLGALVSLGLAVLVTFLVPAHRPLNEDGSGAEQAAVAGAASGAGAASRGADASAGQTEEAEAASGADSGAAGEDVDTETAAAAETEADTSVAVANGQEATETTDGQGQTDAMAETTSAGATSTAQSAETATAQEDVAPSGLAETADEGTERAAVEAAQAEAETEETAASAQPQVGAAADLAAQPEAAAQVALAVPAGETPVEAAALPAISQPADAAGQVAVETETPKPEVGAASGPVAPSGTALGQGAVIAALDPAPAQAPLQKPEQPREIEAAPTAIDAAADVPKPAVGTAAGLAAADAPQAAPALEVKTDEPVLPNPQALAPMEPQDAPVGAIDTAPAAAPANQQGTTPQEPTSTPTRIVANSESAQGGRTTKLAGSLVNREGRGSAIRINRPTDDDGAQIAPNETTSATAAAPQDAPDGASGPPIARFAQGFDDPGGKPLMSIVLMDSGVDLAADEIGLPALKSFPYPVSFAVDYSLPDAAERMEKYRAEGFEVLAMIDLPRGAQATDVEVTMSVAMERMSSVVGVLDGTETGLQESREAADQVTAVLAASGHGLVTQPQGLNTMPKLARKQGVLALPVFRDFDGKGQDARVIRRFLDQAAFKARQEGGVIMQGRLRPETIKALLVWGLADRATQVALVPVSAVLRAAPQ